MDCVKIIDTLIIDCAEEERLLTSGQYIAHCVKLVEMVQKLTKLKDEIKKLEEKAEEAEDSGL